jgi:beta-lactamase class C
MFILLFGSINSRADTDPGVIVNKTIQSFMKANRIPGVVVELYVDGKPYSYNFGYANVATKKPVTDDTIFEIGSVSKLFTTLLLALEVNAGMMKFNDPVSKYLPDTGRLNIPFDRITLKDLATHTSGLAFNAPHNIKSEDALMRYLVRWRPRAPVGSQWAYSNFGMGVLGIAIERRARQSYEQLDRDKILVPLHMSPHCINVPLEAQQNLAQGYDGGGRPELYSPVDILLGAWAIKASGLDMLHFLSAAIGFSDTPPMIINAMRLTQSPSVVTKGMVQGLAWQVHRLDFFNKFSFLHSSRTMHIGPFPAFHLPANEQVFHAGNLIDKTGSMDGFRSYIAVIPEKRSGIVILVNRGVSNGTMINVGRYILFKTSHII